VTPRAGDGAAEGGETVAAPDQVNLERGGANAEGYTALDKRISRNTETAQRGR
jgi:hypothetical protein